MIGGATRRLRIGPAKAKIAKIKLIHKHVDHPNRIIFVNPVIQLLGKQSALTSVHALNKTLHQTLPRKSRENHIT